MKTVSIFLVLLGCALVASAAEADLHDFGEDYYTNLLELGNVDNADLVSYLPESGEFDNAATDTKPVAAIPSAPSCTVRASTIFEIRKMRADAKQIGMAIMYEIQVMEKRKAYIEQMTHYLNDRIRELNKVKQDLAAEQAWIQISNSRISELASKEKLIKLQDIMSCIKSEQERAQGSQESHKQTLESLTTSAKAIEQQIANIHQKIEHVQNNKDGNNNQQDN